MRKKKPSGKRLKVILAGSIVGMGTLTYLPTVQATTIPTVIQEVDTSILSSLEIEDVSFDENFSSDVLDYHATVGNDVGEIRLLTESKSETAIVKANGIQLTNGEAKDFTLQSGKNTFTIIVSDGENESTTYTVIVEKQESDVNVLTDIGLSKGSLSFDPSVSSYTVSVTNNVNVITVTPKWSDRKATVKVNGVKATSKGTKLILPVGKTTVKILVTAENGDEKTYILTINRAGDTTTEASEKDTTKEDGSVPNKTEKKPSSGNKEIEKPSSTSVNSSKREKPRSSSQVSNVQQVASNSIHQVPSGSDREGMSEKSRDEVEEGNQAPVLTTLTASNGIWNKSFESEKFTYHVEVEKDVTSVQIGAIANESGATIKYEGKNSKTVSIKDKAKTAISITVSKSGERRTYVLIFEKDIDVEMDEEETVDDVTDKEIDVEAMNSSTSKIKYDQPVLADQMMPSGNGLTESISFWEKIKKIFYSIFKS